MKNFVSLTIQRKDVNKSEIFIFHKDGNFVHKKIKEDNINIKDKMTKTSNRNELINIFSYSTDYYENVGVNIIRFYDGNWGIFHKDGKIYSNDLLIEPIVEQYRHEIIGFSNDELAPFYTKEGDMAFVNKNCEIITIGKIDRSNDKMILEDKNQRILSEWDFNEVFIPEEYFFLGGNFCTLTENNDFDELFKKFIEEDYINYIFPSEIYGPKIMGKSTMDIGISDKNIINYGKLYILGYVYYTKSEWNNFYFLKQYIKELFQREYDNFKKKISKILGSPLIIDGERYNGWKIKDDLLILDFFCDHGEGDFGYQIRMYIRKD